MAEVKTFALKGNPENNSIDLFVKGEVVNQFYPFGLAKGGAKLTATPLDDAGVAALAPAFSGFLAKVDVESDDAEEAKPAEADAPAETEDQG